MKYIFSALIIHLIHQNVNCRSNISTNDCSKKTDTIEYFEIELKYCGCKRRIKKLPLLYHSSTDKILFNRTTCSLDAYKRGMGQKIVGFSLYGDYTSDRFKVRSYEEGIKENLEMMTKFYPGWIMRLYTDYDIKDQMFGKLCNLACQYPFLDICHVEDLPGTPNSNASTFFPMNWRFFPTLDPQVDLYVSRDLDCRFGDRENGAVQDWLHSDKSIHVMRDHIKHDFPIVGCCWGTKLFEQNIRSKWKMSWKSGQADTIMYSHHDSWGPDQIFLERYVWPWAENEAIGHDSYYCLKYNTNNTKPFPTTREIGPNNFVGAPVMTEWFMENKVRCSCCAKKPKKQKKGKRLKNKFAKNSKKGSSGYQTIVQYLNFWNFYCGKQSLDPNVVWMLRKAK